MLLSIRTSPVVVLVTAGGELGTVPVGKALTEAARVASRLGVTVTLRDPVTNKVIRSVEP
jgi:hypothetical protein